MTYFTKNALMEIVMLVMKFSYDNSISVYYEKQAVALVKLQTEGVKEISTV